MYFIIYYHYLIYLFNIFFTLHTKLNAPIFYYGDTNEAQMEP